MNRAEHLAWCKERAIECVVRGELSEAFSSMVTDLRSRPETDDPVMIELGFALLLNGSLDTPSKMIDFIKGFN